MWTKTLVRSSALVTLAGFLMLNAAACAPDDSKISRVGQTSGVIPPRRPPTGGSKPAPAPKPAGEVPVKPSGVKPRAQKPGIEVKPAETPPTTPPTPPTKPPTTEPPVPPGDPPPAAPKTEKQGKRTRSWGAKDWTVHFAKWGLIGVGFIKLAELVIKTALEAIGSIATSAAEMWKKIIDAWQKKKGEAPPAAPPAGGSVSVTCTETETEIVCVAVIDGPCDPATLGPNERCINPTETCTIAAGGCDPDYEECCGDDMAGYCVVTPGAVCDASNPCCLHPEALTDAPGETDAAGEADAPSAWPEICDLSGGWVSADTPGACGPTVMHDVCEPATDTDGDGTPEYCIQLLDGRRLGGGAGEGCCGETLYTVPLCVCDIWYCDDSESVNCIYTDIPGSEHLCSDATFCDRYALPDDPPDADLP